MTDWDSVNLDVRMMTAAVAVNIGEDGTPSCGALLHPDYLGPHEEWHARTDSE